MGSTGMERTSGGRGRERSVLIIDTSESDGTRLRNEFKLAGWHASFVRPTQTLAELPSPFAPEVVVVEPAAARDGRGPVGCPEAVQQLRARFPKAGIVVVTDRHSLADCFHAARLGARSYLPKPATAEKIIASVEGIHAAGRPDPPPAAIRSLAHNEWEYLAWVMSICGNNKSKAARLLGIQRGSLQRKLARGAPSR
jgi:two-component system, response regulator RegA